MRINCLTESLVPVKPQSEWYCPCEVICEYTLTHGVNKTADEPFFIFRDATPVKPENFHSILKACILDIGLDHDLYNTHRSRKGQAKDLIKAGISVETIKEMGRW